MAQKLDVSVILTPLKRGEQKNKQLYVSYTKWITNESSNEGKLFQARNGVYNEIHKILMQNGLDNLFIKKETFATLYCKGFRINFLAACETKIHTEEFV